MLSLVRKLGTVCFAALHLLVAVAGVALHPECADPGCCVARCGCVDADPTAELIARIHAHAQGECRSGCCQAHHATEAAGPLLETTARHDRSSCTLCQALEGFRVQVRLPQETTALVLLPEMRPALVLVDAQIDTCGPVFVPPARGPPALAG